MPPVHFCTKAKDSLCCGRGPHQNAPKTIAMAIEKLGGRVHDDIRAPFQRPLEVGRHEGIVDAQVDPLSRLPPLLTDARRWRECR